VRNQPFVACLALSMSGRKASPGVSGGAQKRKHDSKGSKSPAPASGSHKKAKLSDGSSSSGAAGKTNQYFRPKNRKPKPKSPAPANGAAASPAHAPKKSPKPSSRPAASGSSAASAGSAAAGKGKGPLLPKASSGAAGNGFRAKSKSPSSAPYGKRPRDAGAVAPGGQYSHPKKKKARFGAPEEKKKVALTKKDRKELRKERRNAKPHADVVNSLNTIFQAAIANMPAADRAAKIREVMDQVKGHIKDVANRHDASRVLQTVIKYGTQQQRLQMFEELRGAFIELSLDHYAHFFILKLVSKLPKRQHQVLLQELSGKLEKLGTHAEAGKIIDAVFTQASRKEKLQMLHEFFGAEFVLFRSNDQEALSFTDIVTAHPEKKPGIALSLVIVGTVRYSNPAWSCVHSDSGPNKGNAIEMHEQGDVTLPPPACSGQLVPNSRGSIRYACIHACCVTALLMWC